MQAIIVIIAIIWVISYAAAKNKAAAKQKSGSAPNKPENTAKQPAQQAGLDGWDCTCGYKNTAASKFCRQCGKARGASGSLAYNSSEGISMEGSIKPAVPRSAPTPMLKHVVAPLNESGHSHTESSISADFGECSETYAEIEDAYSIANPGAAYAAELRNKDKLIQGIILSEILNKPKALRK